MRKFAAIVFVILIFSAALAGCSDVRSIAFAYDSYTVKIGTSFAPELKIRPKNAEYTLSSSNDMIAFVTGNVVTCALEGVVTITATAGDKSATCTVYSTDSEETDPFVGELPEACLVAFFITNYQEVGLASGFLQGIMVEKGKRVTVTDPYLNGYDPDCWYTDENCTILFDPETPIEGNMTLYAKFIPREVDYAVSNGYVTGVLYPRLPHETLTLPDDEEIYGIADNAFKGDTTIKKVIVPSSYQTIGASAFAACTALEEVIIPEDSKLRNIGVNAFGAVQDSENKITGTCKSLKTLSLPDTVTEIGEFGFYLCENLVFENIPTGLTYLRRYAFAGSKIKSVSLKNIREVFEGAFLDCSELESVTDTEGVVRCEKSAFTGTKLESEARTSAINEIVEGNNDGAAYYAGTILFGCLPEFGRARGSGKLRIKEETTLIADEAFTNDGQSELTLYIDTEIAKNAVNNRNFLGNNLFYDSDNVFVVTGNDVLESYAARYDSGKSDYRRYFAEETVKIIEGAVDTHSRGKHILLRKYDKYTYYYDRFIPTDGIVPYTITVNKTIFRLNYDIVRINMSAFNKLDNLISLNLESIGSIAPYGVANCPDLRVIDLTKCGSVVKLETSNSIQFSTCNPSSIKVYVKNADLKSYRNAWGAFSNAYPYLEGK